MGESWPLEAIRDRVHILSGFPFPSSRFSRSEGIPLIRIRDLNSPMPEARYLGTYDERYLVNHGEILLGMDGDFNVVRWQGPQALLNQRVCKIEVADSTLDSGFLFHTLQPALEAVHRKTPQTTVRHLSSRDIRQIAIPVLPEGQQRRIAEVLDSLDESIRSTKRLLAKLRRQKEGMRQRLVDEGTLPWRQDEYSIASDEFDIQSGITLGQHRVPKKSAHPYLRVANVQRGRIDYGEVAHLEASGTDVEVYALHVRDLLVVEGNANPHEIGRCAIVREEPRAPLLFQNHLFRLRPRRLHPEYACLWLNSHRARSYWRRMCATSSGLYTINSRQLHGLTVRVPARAEQKRIAHIMAAHEARATNAQQRIAKLHSIKEGLMKDLLTGRVRVSQAEKVVEAVD